METKQNKKQKNNKSHMDPSEIIIEPFSLQKLTIFSTFPIVIVMIFWLVKEPQKMTGKLLSLTKLTLVTYALFGFCGGYIVTHYQHSLTAAIYVATLASTTWTSQQPSSNILDELPFADLSNLLATSRLYGMVLICIPFQVLQVLDAGAQVQRWPLPIVLGCTYGYVVGSLVGVTLLYFQNESANKRKSKQGRSQ